MSYNCEFHDGQGAAQILVTWLDTGTTLALCREDFSPAMINVIAVDLGVDPTKMYEVVKRFVDKSVKAAAAETEQAAAQATAGDGGAPVGGGTGSDDGGHGEKFSNDGVTVRVPDTGGAEQ